MNCRILVILASSDIQRLYFLLPSNCSRRTCVERGSDHFQEGYELLEGPGPPGSWMSRCQILGDKDGSCFGGRKFNQVPKHDSARRRSWTGVLDQNCGTKKQEH